jgi:hypothetical protein
MDFSGDPLLMQYASVQHDSSLDTSNITTPFLIVVSAEDRGDFPQVPGIGIKLIDVDVRIQFNLGSETQWSDRVDILSQLAGRVDSRLSASCYEPEGTQIINNLSTPFGLKIYGITAEKPRRRSDVDLSRERIVSREFIATAIA